MITNTILGVPDYKYSYNGPQNPILIIKAPILQRKAALRSKLMVLDLVQENGSLQMGFWIYGFGVQGLRFIVFIQGIPIGFSICRVRVFAVNPKP